MTWTLNVGGHTEPAAGETGWRAAEERLAAKVSTFLQEIRDEFGVTTSHFQGNHVSAHALHLPAENAEPESQNVGSDEPTSDAATPDQSEGHTGAVPS